MIFFQISINRIYFVILTLLTICFCFYKIIFLQEIGTPGEIRVNSTNEHKCDRLVKLAGYDQLPVVFLNSFPGSGNT